MLTLTAEFFHGIISPSPLCVTNFVTLGNLGRQSPVYLLPLFRCVPDSFSFISLEVTDPALDLQGSGGEGWKTMNREVLFSKQYMYTTIRDLYICFN